MSKVEISREDARIKYPLIPEALLLSLYRYVESRVATGDALRCILQNDLMGAISHADIHTAQALPDIARFIFNELPGECSGSRDHVRAWLGK